MHSSTSPSSIFKGCTVRFACFCKQSFLRFTPKNGPRKLFFTCRTNPPAKISKRVPRSCQKRPQNPPLDPLKTRPRCVKTSQNHAPDPTWNHKITQTLPRSEKNHFWAAGATIARDKWTPKGASKQDQEQQNPGSMCDAKKT